MSVVAAAVIIAVVVWLTPLDPLPQDAEPNGETSGSLAPDRIAASPDGSSNSKTRRLESSTARPSQLSARKFDWPDKPAELTVEELKAELTKLAQEMSARFPQRADALHVSAMIFKELGQTAEAEATWKRSVALAPKEVGPYLGFANVLSERGRDEEAAAVLQSAQAGGKGSAELSLAVATAQSKLGDAETAYETLRTALEAYPQNAALWLEMGQTQLQLRKLEEAEKAVRQAIELGDSSEKTLITLATILARSRKAEEAAKLRDDLAQRKQGQNLENSSFHDTYVEALRSVAVNCYQLAATILARESAADEAEERLLRAVEIAPETFSTYMELAALYRSQQRVADAFQVHERLLELQPANVFNHINLASIAASLGNLTLAEQVLVRGTEVKPDYAFLYGELAKIHLIKHEFEMAAARAEQAKDLEPENIEWHLMLAAAANGAHDLVRAKAAFSAAKQLKPDDPRVLAAAASMPELTRPAP